MSIEVNVTPFERKELAHPQAGARGHQHERSLSQWQRFNQPSYFIGSQDNGNLLSFCALPHESNGIRVADSVADPLIEQHAHQVSKLSAARPRKRQRSQPKLHLSGFKRFGRVFTPAWDDPFPKVAFIAVSRREGAPGELIPKLALPEMLHKISDRNCWLGRLHVLVDFDLESSDGLSCRGLVGDLVC
ncbi:MAG: hypothetical protein WAL75_23885 [Terracidiphilus sp.]